MEKLVLVDGSNLAFRSYYATAYAGSLMKNSKGFPTNMLYGLITMLNKIINEEKPTYMAVAFDIGRNFRHDLYTEYKAGRQEMPPDLQVQIERVPEILAAMGISYLTKAKYEADDIIGTLVTMAESDPHFTSLIISSDKDLLQLISKETKIKLLKAKDYIRYDEATFIKEYQIPPARIIDLKALAGDSSDHIPGVKGIGEKTALKLLQQYGTLDGVYQNLSQLTPKLQAKLKEFKSDAYFSYQLVTIERQVPLTLKLADLKLKPTDKTKLVRIFEEFEFYSFLKNYQQSNVVQNDFQYQVLTDLKDLKLGNSCAFYLEIDSENYHQANLIGAAISDQEHHYFVSQPLLEPLFEMLKGKELYTYDLKKNRVILTRMGITLPPVSFDLLIAAYLLERNVKDDIAYLMMPESQEVTPYYVLKKAKFEVPDLSKQIVLKSSFIYEQHQHYLTELKKEGMIELFTEIEMPLVEVLSDMELTGVKISIAELIKMRKEIKVKIGLMARKIYQAAGTEFNLNSPRQLGKILFEKLGLPHGKLNKSGYRTDATTLNKLIDSHPIIADVLSYRNLNKLNSTYLEGLANSVCADGKIHTIYKQTLTRTGRLSSVEPNLQNIPTHDEEGRKIKKAFIPSHDLFVSLDYSQIELRLLAHMAKSPALITTFKNNGDIHRKVASDIYGIPEAEVTKEMRFMAKAVIYGIVYGISGFGLGENLNIGSQQASQFIAKYYELYPGVKKYMDKIIKQAYETKVVRTLFNRRRTIIELNHKNYSIRAQGERIALNTPLQGTCADIMKKAMVRIARVLKEQNFKSKMIMQVHDELIFDCVKSEKERLINLVRTIMENIIELEVPIKVEVAVGTTWYEAK